MNQPAPTAERTLGRYQIVKPLKIGGTAAIYLAVMRGENNFSREVVIKRPLPHLVADQRARLMFVDEAHIASRLSHPNICQVLDLVARQDELYLVLEYLRGVDLREILKRCIQLGVLVPPEVAVYVAIEICSGLDFAHEAVGVDGQKLGIVHRDVSPKNIRVTDSGSVKIIDFGIARALGRATETAVGTIKGTLGYMSPEQILGDEIDKRSDIFAFGICLYQMLTCRNPFDGSTLKERVRKLTHAPIPSMREFNPALDEEIDGIVMRCLERDIDKRYQRMREIQLELDRYLAKLQVVSPRQRLIDFLEEIFPHLHETDLDLKNVLTEVSSVTGRIDTEQRLVFPDDPQTEANERQTRPTMSSSGASTVASEPVTSAPDAGVADTKPVQAGGMMVGADERSSLATELDSRSSGKGRPLPWGLIGAALALIAAAMVLVTYRMLNGSSGSIETAPIVDRTPPPPPTVDRTPPPPVKPPPSKAPPPTERVGQKTKHVTKRRPPPPPRRGPTSDRMKARMFLKTGNRLARTGKRDEARLMYHLSFAFSGKSPDAAIYRNLGSLYNDERNVPKAKACLRAYLDRSEGASDAPHIRTIISSYPATKTVPCVSPGEIARARRRLARQGAKIDGWVEETMKHALGAN